MKISIIIPFFNTKHKYLQDLFLSIKSSDCDNFEFIFIDDGSDVGTSKFVKDFCLENEFTYFKFETNGGVSNARNKGIELASNKHVMFLDSDDIIDFSFLNNNKWNEKLDLIMFTDNIFFDSVNICKNQKPVKMSLPTNDISVLYYNNNDKLNLRSSCCKILRKDLIERNHILFDTTLCFYEDAYFMSQYYKRTTVFEAYSNVLYYYRLHNSSSSKKHNPSYIKKYQLYFDKYSFEFKDDLNYLKALYLDTFNSVLKSKFTRSIKRLHLLFAYKLLRAKFVEKSATFIKEHYAEGTYNFKLSKLLIEKKYLSAYWSLLTHRIFSSISIRIRKIFKKN